MVKSVSPYGVMADGTAVDCITLRAENGVEARFIPLGARLIGYDVPDRTGRFEDVIKGHADLAAYESDTAHMGSIAGRVANRIAQACYTLKGEIYHLDANVGPHHLHGGAAGCGNRLWSVVPSEDQNAVQFRFESPAGEGGHAGHLILTVTYWLTSEGALGIRCESHAPDQAAVANLTNHAYFNLAGGQALSLAGHDLQIQAEEVLFGDEWTIPTTRESVVGSCFDFRKTASLSERLAVQHPQLTQSLGFDNCFCLSAEQVPLRQVSVLSHEPTGRCLSFATTEAGIQLYTGNHLPQPQSAVCLETQNWPDSPNRADFPNCVVEAGQTMVQETLITPSVLP